MEYYSRNKFCGLLVFLSSLTDPTVYYKFCFLEGHRPQIYLMTGSWKVLFLISVKVKSEILSVSGESALDLAETWVMQ